MMALQLQHLSFFNMINIKTIEEEENKTLEHIFSGIPSSGDNFII